MPMMRSRWVQLWLGVVCMVIIANLQYGWTAFVLPIDEAHKWERPATWSEAAMDVAIQRSATERQAGVDLPPEQLQEIA